MADAQTTADAIEAVSAVMGHIGNIGPTRSADHAFVVTNDRRIAVLDAFGQDESEKEMGYNKKPGQNASEPFVKVIGDPARVDEVQSVMKCDYVAYKNVGENEGDGGGRDEDEL